MAQGLHGGSRFDAPGVHSLATYLEHAFNDVRTEFGLPPLPAEGAADRQMLFLGIARGIVAYLGDHASAFTIASSSVGNHGNHSHSGAVQIQVEPIPSGP